MNSSPIFPTLSSEMRLVIYRESLGQDKIELRRKKGAFLSFCKMDIFWFLINQVYTCFDLMHCVKRVYSGIDGMDKDQEKFWDLICDEK
jgi:hypothetical protein